MGEEEHRIGPCKMCEYFDFAGQQVAPDEVLARCIQHELKEFEVTVAGKSSCNRFEARSEDLQVPSEEQVSAWRQPARV